MTAFNDFEFYSPTRFIFGKDAELKVGERLKEAGAKRALIHFGSHHAKDSGLIDKVEKSLEDAGVEWVELGGVRPNPEISLVREGQKLCKEHDIDYLIAVGGGSVIDSIKCIADSAHYDGDPWDFVCKKIPVTEALPIAVVLTIPAAGSESSKNSVISNDELGLKTGFGSDINRPKFAFLNPELTMSLPAYQTAAGCTDMFAHLLERFFDDAENIPATDNLNMSLMKTIRANALRVLEEPYNYDARANIMWAGALCHNGIAGCGRHEDWATHGMEHELSALKPDVTHGAGLAVLFPAWMDYVYKENPARFALYGREVFGITTTDDIEADARAAIRATREFFVSMNMPTRLSEFGFVEDDIEKMLPTLKENKGEPFGSFKKLTMGDAVNIYKSAL